MRLTGTALIVAALLSAAPVYAGGKNDHSCCASNAANKQQACVNLTSLGITADQKAKLEAWQADCTKAGCTSEARAKFLEQAKGILSADQYAKLKQQCDASAAKTTQT